ncbi:MAG: hypothetical protein ACOC2J_03805 [bacterium]
MQLADIPIELQGFVPNFNYVLYDFSPQNDMSIRGQNYSKMVLKTLRAIFMHEECNKGLLLSL